MLVAMCRGNCSMCKVKRSVKIIQSSVQEEPVVVEEVREVVEESPTLSRQEDVENVSELSVVPFSSVEVSTIPENPIVDSYAVKKTRKGLVGKLIGG